MLRKIKYVLKKIVAFLLRPFAFVVRKEMLRDMTRLHLTGEIVAVHSSSFGKYRHCYTGKKVVVVATGATLNDYEPIEDAVHIGVNAAYEANVKLDFLVVSDFDAAYRDQSFYKGIEELSCEKFFAYWIPPYHLRKTCSESFAIKVNAKRFFADYNNTKFPIDIRYHPLASCGTVAIHALQFAMFTNPSELYLVGCDASPTGHFNGDTTTDQIIAKNAAKYVNGYIKFKEFAKLHYPDTKIISINPVGLKGIFEDIFTT